MNGADVTAYDEKMADCLARLDAAHADEDRQHMVPDLTSELVALKGNRAGLAARLARAA